MCLFDSLDLFSQDFPTPVSGGKRKKRKERERLYWNLPPPVVG